jgi:hypothetical protein
MTDRLEGRCPSCPGTAYNIRFAVHGLRTRECEDRLTNPTGLNSIHRRCGEFGGGFRECTRDCRIGLGDWEWDSVVNHEWNWCEVFVHLGYWRVKDYHSLSCKLTVCKRNLLGERGTMMQITQ